MIKKFLALALVAALLCSSMQAAQNIQPNQGYHAAIFIASVAVIVYASQFVSHPESGELAENVAPCSLYRAVYDACPNILSITNANAIFAVCKNTLATVAGVVTPEQLPNLVQQVIAHYGGCPAVNPQ